VKHRATWRVGFAAIAASALACAGATTAFAQTPPPWAITVHGQPVDQLDVVQSLMLQFADGKTVPKDRAQMPAFAPYAWYAGRDNDGKPLIWTSVSSDATAAKAGTVQSEAAREYAAARVLIALDFGKGGATWQRLYHALPDDPAARNAFAVEIVDAAKAASAWTVAKSDADRHWLFASIRAGASRHDVYALLDARGLSATDPSERTAKPATGVAAVKLDGAFGPGCSFTHIITITFDADDRVRKLDLAPPHPNCL
jgi:hypothetical protein